MIKVTIVANGGRKSVMAQENETVKQTLEKNDATIGNASVSIDGAVLGAGQINKSYSELGVNDHCVVSVMANKEGAAKATIVGSAAVIASQLTPEQIQRFEQWHPELLTMVDEADDPVYGIAYDENGPGSINANGAVFGSATDAEGHATITVVLDPTSENLEDLVYNKLGGALLKLKELEDSLLEKVGMLDEEETVIRSQITRI